MVLSEYKELQNANAVLIQGSVKDAPSRADIQKIIYIMALEYGLDMLQLSTELAECVVNKGSFCEVREQLQDALRAGMTLEDASRYVRKSE